MASWRTIFLVKLLTLWNTLSETYISVNNKCIDFYYYLRDYFYGHHDIWIFMPGHTFPLSLNNVSNMVHINWIYNNADNSLTFGTNGNIHVNHCSLSWLSAKIRIITSEDPGHALEYEIDEFIQKFVVHTIDDVPPTLYMIFMCWCAYTKHWFNTSDHFEFHIIDDMGEDLVLNIATHNNSFYMKNNKLFIKIDSDTNNTTIEKTPTIEEFLVETIQPLKRFLEKTQPLEQEEEKKDN
jgi:hypothetical protein